VSVLLQTSFPMGNGRILSRACAKSLHTSEESSKPRSSLVSVLVATLADSQIGRSIAMTLAVGLPHKRAVV
jgi:hypothetical protein